MDLKIYDVVLELVRLVAPLVVVLRAHSAELGDQCERALISIPLNTAEGAIRGGATSARVTTTRSGRRARRSRVWKQLRPLVGLARSIRA